MDIIVTRERIEDYKLSEDVIKKAFENAEYTDHKEQFLVKRLRKSHAFIPELSLIAKEDEKIVGHIMFTKIFIEDNGIKYESLALAPVSVLPKYQNIGVGSSLINKGLKKAKEIGFKSVIVLGYEKYYPRFGFKVASALGIKAPFHVPDECFMALELVEGGLKGVKGTVIYSKEFS